MQPPGMYTGPEPQAHDARVAFSRTEVLHLAGSVVILTLAFTFVLSEGDGLERLVPSPVGLLASFLAVTSGFVLHELAHKLVATRMGHWAEFRAQFNYLVISLLVAAGLGFLFAAPGAVLIQGRVSLRQNGIISIVGPATNLLIALLALPFTVRLNIETDTTAMVFRTVAFVNALLAVFNLLPIGILDGRKVWWWSKTAWFGAMGAAASLLVYMAYKFGGAPSF